MKPLWKTSGWAKKDATDDEVIACAKASGCHNFIQSLPHGYQTVVGGSGGHLLAESASV